MRVPLVSPGSYLRVTQPTGERCSIHPAGTHFAGSFRM
jgi:hypothetical protein